MIKIVVVEVVVIVLQLFSKSSSRYGTSRRIEFVMIKVVVDYYYSYCYSYCCNGRSSGYSKKGRLFPEEDFYSCSRRAAGVEL